MPLQLVEHAMHLGERNALSTMYIIEDSQLTIVGNSRICFLSDSLFFLSESAIHSFFEQIAHSRSFVKSDRIKSLMSLFKKEQLSEGSDSLLGIKKGSYCQKHTKNTIFYDFLAICSRRPFVLCNLSESLTEAFLL